MDLRIRRYRKSKEARQGLFHRQICLKDITNYHSPPFLHIDSPMQALNLSSLEKRWKSSSLEREMLCPSQKFSRNYSRRGCDFKWDLEPSIMFLIPINMDNWTPVRSSWCKVGFLLHLFQMQLCNWPADWPETSCVIMKADCTVFQLLPIHQHFQLQKEEW